MFPIYADPIPATRQGYAITKALSHRELLNAGQFKLQIL